MSTPPSDADKPRGTELAKLRLEERRQQRIEERRLEREAARRKPAAPGAADKEAAES